MDLSKFKIKDEAFSKKEFGLTTDKNEVLETIPKPENLSDYYNFGGYISHQSNKKTVVHGIYNLVRKQMFNTKYKLLRKGSLNLKSVLDFGCGTGEFVEFLKDKNIEAEGVEPTSNAYQKTKEKNIEVYKNLNDVTKSYDAITLFHVLEHVDNYDQTMKQLVSKLNSKGLLLIAVPNYKSHDANYYKEKWAAWDVPRHLWHFNRKNIKDLANRHNLELIKISPMPFDALYISMVSESYRGNSKVFGLWQGIISNLKALKTKEYSSNLFLMQKKL